jgi:hypothetical protein
LSGVAVGSGVLGFLAGNGAVENGSNGGRVAAWRVGVGVGRGSASSASRASRSVANSSDWFCSAR